MWSARPVLAAVPDVLGRVAAALDYMVTAPAGSPDALAGGVAFLCALDLVKEVAVVQSTALRHSAAVLTSIVTTYRSVAQRLLEKLYVRVRVRERVRTLITMAVAGAWRVVADCPQVLSRLVDDIAIEWRIAAQQTEGGTDPPLPTAQGRGHPLFIYLYLLSSFLAAGGLVPDRSAPMMVTAAAAAPVWSAFGRIAPGAGPQRPACDDNPIAAGREWELFGTLLLHAPQTDHVVVVDESSTVTVPQGPAGAPPTHMPTGTVLLTCEGGACGHIPPASFFLGHIYVREVNYG